jgi:CDP-glucose 4,6-dehydratase
MKNYNIKNYNFFYKKRVLITGHTGFKGAWLTKFLLNFKAKILGISLSEVSQPNLFNILNLKKNIADIRCDIRNFNKIKKIILKFKPEFIFHLAAESLLIKSYKNPRLTFETNFNGTLNIIEIAKQVTVLKGIVIVTSDKCYEVKNKNVLFKENDPLGGIDPYSASKAACEILAKSYSNNFTNNNIGFATARAGNVIGGGDWSDNRIIPDIIRSYTKNKKILIRNPFFVRPWHHVFDCIASYITLMAKISQKPKSLSGSYNFGPHKSEKEINVLQLTKIFFKELCNSYKNKYVIGKKNKYYENRFLRLNVRKSENLLNIKNKFNIYKSIVETTTWYKNYFEKNDIKKFSEEQMFDYLKK